MILGGFGESQNRSLSGKSLVQAAQIKAAYICWHLLHAVGLAELAGSGGAAVLWHSFTLLQLLNPAEFSTD